MLNGEQRCDVLWRLGVVQALFASVNILLSTARQFMAKALSDAGKRGDRCALLPFLSFPLPRPFCMGSDSAVAGGAHWGSY